MVYYLVKYTLLKDHCKWALLEGDCKSSYENWKNIVQWITLLVINTAAETKTFLPGVRWVIDSKFPWLSSSEVLHKKVKMKTWPIICMLSLVGNVKQNVYGGIGFEKWPLGPNGGKVGPVVLEGIGGKHFAPGINTWPVDIWPGCTSAMLLISPLYLLPQRYGCWVTRSDPQHSSVIITNWKRWEGLLRSDLNILPHLAPVTWVAY